MYDNFYYIYNTQNIYNTQKRIHKIFIILMRIYDNS